MNDHPTFVDDEWLDGIIWGCGALITRHSVTLNLSNTPLPIIETIVDRLEGIGLETDYIEVPNYITRQTDLKIEVVTQDDVFGELPRYRMRRILTSHPEAFIEGYFLVRLSPVLTRRFGDEIFSFTNIRLRLMCGQNSESTLQILKRMGIRHSPLKEGATSVEIDPSSYDSEPFRSFMLGLKDEYERFKLDVSDGEVVLEKMQRRLEQMQITKGLSARPVPDNELGHQPPVEAQESPGEPAQPLAAKHDRADAVENLPRNLIEFPGNKQLIVRYPCAIDHRAGVSYWFDLPKGEIDHDPLGRLYVMFILGSEDSVLIIPSATVQHVIRGRDSSDNWLLRITGTVATCVSTQTPGELAVPRHQLSCYLNRYQILGCDKDPVWRRIKEQLASEICPSSMAITSSVADRYTPPLVLSRYAANPANLNPRFTGECLIHLSEKARFHKVLDMSSRLVLSYLGCKKIAEEALTEMEQDKLNKILDKALSEGIANLPCQIDECMLCRELKSIADSVGRIQ